MKKIVLVLFVLIMHIISFANVKNDGGSIVIIGEDCIVNTNNNNNVTSINIYDINGAPVLITQGCFNSTCNIDISSLPSGEYNVVVNCSNQSTFNSEIRIK